MPIALVATSPLEGLEVRAAPVGGAVWDRGALVALAEGRVAWSRPLAVPPLLAAAGRRLYVAFEDVLACLDARTGADVWAESTRAPIHALAAHRDGVDVACDGALLAFAPDGTAGATLPLRPAVTHLDVSPSVRHIGGPDGVWRVERDGRLTRLSANACIGLRAREGGVQARVATEQGTLLVEDEGLPLVWPFPDAARHLVAPYGRAEWAVAPTEGPGGVWVIDRRVRARWSVPLPGVSRALAVTGDVVLALVDDDGTVLAVTHPDVSRPLLLGADGAEGLVADAGVVYLAERGRTRIYRLREA